MRTDSPDFVSARTIWSVRQIEQIEAVENDSRRLRDRLVERDGALSRPQRRAILGV